MDSLENVGWLVLKTYLFLVRLSSPAHDHLVVGDVETVQRLDVGNLNGVPRDVVNRPRGLVDEVVVILDVCVKDDGTRSKGMSSKETFLDEKVQSVVDRGPRDHGKLAAHTARNLFRGRMFIGV